jgi:hypothetical protein
MEIDRPEGLEERGGKAPLEERRAGARLEERSA